LGPSDNVVALLYGSSDRASAYDLCRSSTSRQRAVFLGFLWSAAGAEFLHSASGMISVRLPDGNSSGFAWGLTDKCGHYLVLLPYDGVNKAAHSEKVDNPQKR